MTNFRISVKEKGRIVLPVALQRECGFAPGDELVARPIGEGRFIVESSDAILQRIWSRVPAGSTGAVESLDEWRTETEKARAVALESPEMPTEEESARRAALLLAELGL